MRADEPLKRRLSLLTQWQQEGGVCVIGFEAFLTLTTRSAKAAAPLLQ